jgi:plastocyanin
MQRLPYRIRYLAFGLLFVAAACAAPATPAASTSSMPPMSMQATVTTGGQQPVASNTVTIKDFAFSPQVITIKAGTTVTWTNTDSDAHTVTSQNGTGPLHSAALVTGSTYSYTFHSPGRYDYLCTIHPFMTATVVVTP